MIDNPNEKLQIKDIPGDYRDKVPFNIWFQNNNYCCWVCKNEATSWLTERGRTEQVAPARHHGEKCVACMTVFRRGDILCAQLFFPVQYNPRQTLELLQAIATDYSPANIQAWRMYLGNP